MAIFLIASVYDNIRFRIGFTTTEKIPSKHVRKNKNNFIKNELTKDSIDLKIQSFREKEKKKSQMLPSRLQRQTNPMTPCIQI